MTEQTKSLYVLTLWYKPMKSMQGLIESGRGHRVALAVAMFFGLVQAGRFYIADEAAGSLYYAVGALAGLVGLFLFSWLLRNFGRWFGGQASLKEVRTGLGLGLMPWLVLFLGLSLTLGGGETDAEALASFYWLFFVGFLYGYTILLLSLSTMLRLSVLKTFLCLIVTFIFTLFPLTLLIQLLAPGMIPAQ